MDIEQRYEPKPFADLKYGVLCAGTIGERCGIHGIKAHAAPDVGSEDNYFVTVGPFDEEYGPFPVLHHPSSLHEPVLELIGGYQISPSLSPDDLVSHVPLGDAAHGVLLILKQNQILMSVADIGSTGRMTRCWLDVKAGEIVAPLKHADYIVTRGWRLAVSVENAPPATIFNFKAETEST